MKFTFESCTTYFKMLQKILSNSDAKTDIYTRAPTHKIQSDGGVEAPSHSAANIQSQISTEIENIYTISTIYCHKFRSRGDGGCS